MKIGSQNAKHIQIVDTSLIVETKNLIELKTNFDYNDYTSTNNEVLIGVRTGLEFKNKGFRLNDRFNWTIGLDSGGCLILIPSKKN